MKTCRGPPIVDGREVEDANEGKVLGGNTCGLKFIMDWNIAMGMAGFWVCCCGGRG